MFDAGQLGAVLTHAVTLHSRWRFHPLVRSPEKLTFGERTADRMKAVFATWTALLGILAIMAVWIWTHGFGIDAAPFILLNLCLSCLAALQCFILLIAAKRADQISSELARHDYETDQRVETMIRELHAHILRTER
jgi:uncharacterized membrane protein